MIELGDLVVDLEKRAVTVAGEPVHLTPHQFELLRVLAVNRGQADDPPRAAAARSGARATATRRTCCT